MSLSSKKNGRENEFTLSNPRLLFFFGEHLQEISIHFMVKAMSSCRSMFPVYPIHRSKLQLSGYRNSPANHPQTLEVIQGAPVGNRERLVESTGNLHGFNVCGFCNYTLRWAIKKNNVNLCFCHHLMVFLQPRLRNSRESPSAMPSFGGPFKKWCHPKIGWLIWWVGTKKINLLIRVWGIGGTMWKPIKTTRQGEKGPVTITHNGVFRPSITLK